MAVCGDLRLSPRLNVSNSTHCPKQVILNPLGYRAIGGSTVRELNFQIVDMTIGFTNLRGTVSELKQQLQAAEARLMSAERSCNHNWTEALPDHIYEKAYTIPGDRLGDPGYGGVDRQFDCHVPAKTEKRWKRICKTCGLVEHTKRVKEVVTENPTFD